MNNSGVFRQGNIIPSVSSSIMKRSSALPPTESLSSVTKFGTTEVLPTMPSTDTVSIVYAQGPSAKKTFVEKASDFLASLRGKKPDISKFEEIKQRALKLDAEILSAKKEVDEMTPKVKEQEKKIAAWQIYFSESERTIKEEKSEIAKQMGDKSLNNDDKLVDVMQAKAMMEANPSSEEWKTRYNQRKEIFDISNTIVMSRVNNLLIKKNDIEIREKALLAEKATIEAQIEAFRSQVSTVYLPKVKELHQKRKELRDLNQQIFAIQAQIDKISPHK